MEEEGQVEVDDKNGDWHVLLCGAASQCVTNAMMPLSEAEDLLEIAFRQRGPVGMAMNACGVELEARTGQFFLCLWRLPST